MDLLQNNSLSDCEECLSHDQHRSVEASKSIREIKDGRVVIVSECATIRSKPHVRGNWAGHIFVDLSCCPPIVDSVPGALERFRERMELSGYSGEIMTQRDFHLSLSRPFYLQEASIESFATALRDRLKFQPSFVIKILFHGKCLVNDEKTRSFWTWPVQQTDDLRSTLQGVDDVLAQYDQPSYYIPAFFHISIASACQAVACPKNIDEPVGHGFTLVTVKTIACTFGTTKVFGIPLGVL